MSDKPKRPWFRFHLLTAVLMMLAASGALWWELTAANDGIFRRFGWPLTAYRVATDYGALLISLMTSDDGRPVFYGKAIFVDSIIALGGVLAIGILCELLLRRREGRKP